MTARILVVEDDPQIAGEVVRGLKARDFAVELATTGDQASSLVQKETFDFIVLDIMLPGKSGFVLLDEWKSRITTPILVLTARTDLDDRLRAFQKGALDFLSKPFWIEELVARLQARLGQPAQSASRVIAFGRCELDLDARSLRVAGRAVSLTPHEFNLLAHLATRQGRAISRQQLAEQGLSVDAPISDRTVDAHIARLRKKLGDDGQCVCTVWGVGYRFTPPTP